MSESYPTDDGGAFDTPDESLPEFDDSLDPSTVEVPEPSDLPFDDPGFQDPGTDFAVDETTSPESMAWTEQVGCCCVPVSEDAPEPDAPDTLVWVDPEGNRNLVPAVDIDGMKTVLLDANGDGQIDTWAVDPDRTGRITMMYLDADGDGEPDAVLEDPTGSGQWSEPRLLTETQDPNEIVETSEQQPPTTFTIGPSDESVETSEQQPPTTFTIGPSTFGDFGDFGQQQPSSITIGPDAPADFADVAETEPYSQAETIASLAKLLDEGKVGPGTAMIVKQTIEQLQTSQDEMAKIWLR